MTEQKWNQDKRDQAFQDALIHGEGFMKDGKRVDPKDVYKFPPSEESMKIAENVWYGVCAGHVNDLFDAADAFTCITAIARALDERYDAGKEDAWRTKRDEESY